MVPHPHTHTQEEGRKGGGEVKLGKELPYFKLPQGKRKRATKSECEAAKLDTFFDFMLNTSSRANKCECHEQRGLPHEKISCNYKEM